MASLPAVDRADTRPAAQTQLITLQVLAVTPVARDTITLALVLPGTSRPPGSYLPGQFITLAFPGTNTVYYRSYSLCGDGRGDYPWEITVKRQNAGIVSSYIYSHVRPNMLLQSSLPQGRFTLPATVSPDQLFVFVAAGSGITPIYSMLRALTRLPRELRPRVLLHYAYHNKADAIYGPELAALDPERSWLTQWHYVTTSGHHMGVEQVLASMGSEASGAEWYICGPAGLKRNLESALPSHGIPPSHIHTEVFSSPTIARTTGASAVAASHIRLVDSGAVLDAAAGETLLQTLERYGYRPDFNCRTGACGTCRLRLLSGKVEHGAGAGLTSGERAAGYVLSCVAVPAGDIALASAGQPVARRVGNEGSQVALRRKNAKKKLRLGLVAATIGLFFTAWSFTNHSPGSQASSSSSSNTTSPTSPSFVPSDTGGSSSSSGQGQSNSGPVFGQPSQSAPNTSTGVS
ncbi:MAG: 2Fe-2S iron-sulfur cluster-binding protein [Ktedonobacterales bacterium]